MEVTIKNRQLKAMAAILSLAMAFGLTVPVYSTNIQAATTKDWTDASTDSKSWSDWKANWEDYSSNYEYVSLTPGTDESKLNFAWYSHTEETP
ncbi:MAG: hypothetical protein UHS41_06415 [Lachnospiraceae bacterium]|nr:hypothetical protein [Lachnospiraceae bacterium]